MLPCSRFVEPSLWQSNLPGLARTGDYVHSTRIHPARDLRLWREGIYIVDLTLADPPEDGVPSPIRVGKLNKRGTDSSFRSEQ